jgi:hypothetical protein
MSKSNGGGRLGNQIIRNLAVSILASKYNLSVDYSSKDLINKLGIDLYNGSNVYKLTQNLNEANYFNIYNCGNINYNLNANNAYFQSKDITNFLYNYLHTDLVKSNIIEKNPFKDRYNTNNDLFIHIRLTDVKQHNPGLNYYLNAIKSITFDNLYISTDEINHDIIKNILLIYPNVKLIEYDEINTFQFASTCKHILLSHGSFSAIIGYLSFYSTIYYPEYDINHMWYGDIFSINNWIKCNNYK